MDKKRLFLLFLGGLAIATFFYFDGGRFLTLEALRERQGMLAAHYAEHRAQTIVVYFSAYVLLTALSLPGATVMTLAGGAFLGLVPGTLVVSFASSLGATLAFLSARFIFREAVRRRFARRLKTIDAGLGRDGPFYLFILRLVPIFPFFVINLLMGVTSMRVWTFYWVSQLGMLAGTLVYVNLGRELTRIDSLAGLLEPRLLIAFTLLGLLPVAARGVLRRVHARRVYANWRRPAAFDYNIVVIGAGSAGLVSAYVAATLRAKVALIEAQRMGGDCLNTGCVPSKALIRSARLLSRMRRAREFGIEAGAAACDFPAIMRRVAQVIRTIEPHDSAARYAALGVECLEGHATVTTPWTVEVATPTGMRTLTTKSIVIATGARPAVPEIPGLAAIGYLTSETVWSLRELPRRLLVLGGGSIGVELAQAFARLGSQVTLVEKLPRLLMSEDPEVAVLLEQRFENEGIRVLTGHEAKAFVQEGAEKILRAEHADETLRIAFDEVLVAVGRTPNARGSGLEALGISLTDTGAVETSAALETRYPNIYACGDVVGPYQYTHAAAHQAWYATINALFGRWRKLRVDYSVIPTATFTDPEVARVGVNEIEAAQQSIAVDVTRYGIDDLDRAIVDGEAHGFVKLLTQRGTDRLLGVTIVGEHAADLLAEYVLAMRNGLGLRKVLDTIHIYPTLAEANKYAAGAWRASRVTEGQRSFLATLQSWRRGERTMFSLLSGVGALLMDQRRVNTAARSDTG